MHLTLEQAVEYLTVLTYVAAEVVVLFYVAPAWRRLRYRFLALIAIASALGLYTIIGDYTIGRGPSSEEQYYWYWMGRQAVSAVCMICYASGVYLMVRHVLRTHVERRPVFEEEPEQRP
ncbi:MAG: hypothetical protein ACO1QR_05445 [Chthoniobacteraceae bacterium]